MTLAHPAAILPLRWLPLPVAPMVIATMVPDIPMFLPSRAGYGLTHSGLGLLTVDVVATLILLAAWDRVLRDALVDLSPGPVRDRFHRRRRLSRPDWLLAPAAAVVGALTHIAWDAFTHADRWGVTHVPWLRADHSGLPGYKWAQYVSGVVGLVVVGWACVGHVRARSAVRRSEPRALPAAVMPSVLGAAVAVAGAAALARFDEGFHAVAFHGVVTGIQAGTVGLAGLGGWWLWVAHPQVPSVD